MINVDAYVGPDRNEKSSAWLRDAQAVLYDQELQARVLLLPHSSVREPLQPTDVEAIGELERVAHDLLADQDGNGILAMLQIRREAFKTATGMEVIGEQIAMLGLLAPLLEEDPIVVHNHHGSNRPGSGW